MSEGYFLLFLAFWVNRSFLWAFNECHVISEGPNGFWWEIHSDSDNNFSFFSCCFQGFLPFCFQQFNCDVSGCGFICVYPTWDLLNFLNLVYVFCQIWGVFSHWESNAPPPQQGPLSLLQCCEYKIFVIFLFVPGALPLFYSTIFSPSFRLGSYQDSLSIFIYFCHLLQLLRQSSEVLLFIILAIHSVLKFWFGLMSSHYLLRLSNIPFISKSSYP